MINRKILHSYVDDLAAHLHYLLDSKEMEPDLQEKYYQYAKDEQPEQKMFWSIILDFILHCWANEILPSYFMTNIRQSANWQKKILQALLKRLA